MSAQRTPWFPSSVKPARPGIYEIVVVILPEDERQIKSDGFAHFDGKKWGTAAATAEAAWDLRKVVGHQEKRWRGIASDPTKEQP